MNVRYFDCDVPHEQIHGKWNGGLEKMEAPAGVDIPEGWTPIHAEIHSSDKNCFVVVRVWAFQ